MNKIGQAIKDFFARNGISQKEAAERLGVTAQTINGLLSGSRKFGKKTAKRWHDEFGFSISFLCSGEGELTDEDTSLNEQIALLKSQIEELKADKKRLIAQNDLLMKRFFA